MPHPTGDATHPCSPTQVLDRRHMGSCVLNYLVFLSACLGALCGLLSPTFAQTAPPSNNNSVDEVVVVANRAPELLSKIGNSVTVLNEAAITESEQIVVSDLLAQTPGVTFARAGGVGTTTQVYIRGAESDQTVVLIDGVQLNDPSQTGGGFDFANLLTSDISRIEILRGAQSTLYGSQAIGGVINIRTAEPTSPFGGNWMAEGGSHDTGYVNGGIGGKDDALLWRVSGNWYGTSGIPDFDEKLGGTRLDASQIGGGSGQLRYDLTPDLQVDLRGYYTQARTDFDGYDTPTMTLGNDYEYTKIDQSLAYAGLTLRSPDRTLTNRLAFQYTDTETRNYDPNAPANYGIPSSETFYGVGRNEREEYQGTWAIAAHDQLVIGVQHERSTINTFDPQFDPAPTAGYATIDSGYLQLQDEVVSGLNVTAGERYDRHNVYGGDSTGQIAAAWALTDGSILRASFGQGFKAPSLYQLYSQYGNSALRPETAESWDLGIENRTWNSRVLWSATYFKRSSRDLIDFFFCPSPQGCPNPNGGYYANIDRALAHGVELQVTVTPTAELKLAANYTLTDTVDKSPGSATFGNSLPRRPKDAANASVTYRWPSLVSTSLAARYAGPSFDDSANQIELGGYVLLDVRASYPIRNGLEVYGRIENATGRHYETAYQYGTLSRVAYVGIRDTF
jgi:vitamin B12 transporter